jgi:DNA-binding MarR family transcriptional regulator
MGRPTPNELAEELRDVLSTLRRLDVDGPATTADLARAELVTPQTAGALVAKLEEEGYVTRREDARDGRCRFVALTAAGRKAVAVRRAEKQSWFAQRIADHLDASEQRTLATALTLLRRIINA